MYQFSIGQESIENEAYHKKKKKKSGAEQWNDSTRAK